jgi:hypothetical protein
MLKSLFCVATSLMFAFSPAHAAEDPSDVEAVVAAVKAANPDSKALCEKGTEAIRKATTEAVMGLMGARKLKGNPRAVGGEAGGKIALDCNS